MKLMLPIYSRYDDQVELRDAIEQFVVGLGERIDELQDLQLQGQLLQLADKSDALAADGQRLGYAQIDAVARQISQAARQDKPEEAQKALVEITELMQRVRRGSRGAA